MRILFELAAGCAISTGLCLVAWRMTLPGRLLLLGFFLFVTSPLHWGGDALLIDLGMFAWGLLCFLESGPRLPIFVAVLVALAAVGALVKLTFLVIGLFTVGWLACDLISRGKRRLAAVMVMGFVLAVLLEWMLLGQNLSGVGAFLSSSFAIVTGYNGAMSRRIVDVTLVLMMSVCSLVAVIIRVMSFPNGGTGRAVWRRGLLLAWLTGLFFEEWKYGCVRSDEAHVAFVIGFVPLAAICLEALPAAGIRAVIWSRAFILFGVFATFLLISSEISAVGLATVRQACGQLSQSFVVLTQPARYLREKTEALEARQKLAQLPKIRATLGRATMDVFGRDQTTTLFNELNYQPRLIFQSYSAYSRRLMELNEQCYLSKAFPEYVLFSLHAIDGRFPPLEDSFILRDVLANYELAFKEGDFLLLRRKGTAAVQMTLVKEGTVRAGEKIDLGDQRGANLWLEIDLQPTLLGRLQQFLYKPAEIQLVEWSQSETAAPVKFRAPAAMLSAGFLANPVVTGNQDVMDLYAGGKRHTAGAYSVEFAPSPVAVWQPQIRFQIYRIENKIGSRSS